MQRKLPTARHGIHSHRKLDTSEGGMGHEIGREKDVGGVPTGLRGKQRSYGGLNDFYLLRWSYESVAEKARATCAQRCDNA